MFDCIERNWRRSWLTSAWVKPPDRSLSKPRRAGMVVVCVASCPSFLPAFEFFAVAVIAMFFSSSNSSSVKISPIAQLIYTLGACGSIAFPFPLGSYARGGAAGILRTADRMSSSLRSLPLWIRRSLFLEDSVGRSARSSCLKAATLVLVASGNSRRRSGMSLKRTEMRRGVEDLIGASYEAGKLMLVC